MGSPLMDETPPSAKPHTGGSAAGQALRAEMPKQGIDPESEFAAATAAAQVHPPSTATPPTDARTAVRKKVTGRARLALHGSSVTLSGKMMDISTTGACVLMEDLLPPKKLCQLS